MNRQHTTLFIADTSVGFDSLGLPKTQKCYPNLVRTALDRPMKTQQDLELLGRILIKICRQAHSRLQVDILREASDFLVSLPVRNELRAIGRHYQAQVLHRSGNFDAARFIFEEVATQPETEFPWKAAAIFSAASCYFDRGSLDAAMTLYLESQHVAANQGSVDVLNTLKSQWMLAVIQSVHGDHNSALQSLESIYPLVQYVARTQAAAYYDYLNSLAVEQIALKHFDQAEQLCNVFLSCQFAPNFPNWSETRDELHAAKEAVASTVFINVEHTSQQTPNIETHTIKAPEFTAVPLAELSVIAFEEIESILESQLFFNRAATEIILRTNRAETVVFNAAQATSLLSKSEFRIPSVLYFGFQITSTPKPNRRTVSPLIKSEMPPLVAAAYVAPDNRRPRAPPTIFQTSTRRFPLVL